MEKGPLNHPVRVQMVRMIGDNEGLTYSEIKEQVGLSTGSIYYHLNVLDEHVTKDEGLYVLTEKGRETYDAILDGTFFQEYASYGGEAESKSAEVGLPQVVLMAPFFERLASDRRLAVLTGLIVLPLESLATTLLEVNQFLYVFSTERVFNPALSVLLSWLLTFLVLYFVVSSIYREVGDLQENVALLVAIPISYLPLYLFVVLFQRGLASPTLGAFFYLLSALLVASALTYVKRIEIEQALLISLLFLFVNVGVRPFDVF